MSRDIVQNLKLLMRGGKNVQLLSQDLAAMSYRETQSHSCLGGSSFVSLVGERILSVQSSEWKSLQKDSLSVPL